MFWSHWTFPVRALLVRTFLIRTTFLFRTFLKVSSHFQRRIDEATDIHDDFRLWFTWQNEQLPQLQLLQKSIIIHCQPIRALRYHSNLFVYRCVPIELIN